MRDKPIQCQLEHKFSGTVGPTERALGGFETFAEADHPPQHIGQPRPDGGHRGVETLPGAELRRGRIMAGTGAVTDRRRD